MNEKSIKSANNILNVIIVTAIIAIIGIVGSIFFSRKGNIITSKNMTAEEICNELKNNNNNIGKIVVYTEETDSNNLLGRPNQYTSKVNFADNRISQ